MKTKMTDTQKETNLLMGVNKYTLKLQTTVLNLPFQVKFMENTCKKTIILK